jgi:hypothetical protein
MRGSAGRSIGRTDGRTDGRTHGRTGGSCGGGPVCVWRVKGFLLIQRPVERKEVSFLDVESEHRSIIEGVTS